VLTVLIFLTVGFFIYSLMLNNIVVSNYWNASKKTITFNIDFLNKKSDEKNVSAQTTRKVNEYVRLRCESHYQVSAYCYNTCISIFSNGVLVTTLSSSTVIKPVELCV